MHARMGRMERALAAFIHYSKRCGQEAWAGSWGRLLGSNMSWLQCGCSVAAVWLQCGCSVAAVWLQAAVT